MKIVDIVEKLGGEPMKRLRSIEDETGVPYSTLLKLRYKTTTNPSARAVERLADFYRKDARRKPRKPKEVRE